MSHLKTFTIIVMLGFSGAAWAQTGQYRLNPGDILEISIWKDDAMLRTVTVLPDGMISYPLAGHINVAGMTAAELERELTNRLIEGRFYTNPALNVRVVQTQGNQIYVLGEVRTPGAFEAKRRLDVMQALSLAGGLTEYADRNDIVILRRNGNQRRTFRFDYAGAMSGGRPERNIVLESGDTVVVPSKGLF